MQKEKFSIQDSEYSVPYHHLVDFKHFSNAWIMPWGQEYYTYVKKALDLLKKFNPKSIIDIGCGDGKIGLELTRIYGNKIQNVGVDLSERAVLLAKALNWGSGAEFFCLPIDAIQKTFEMAMLIEVLEHIPDNEIDSFVHSIYERLDIGGIIILSVPSDCIPVSNKHYRHYNKQLLDIHMKGFKLQEIYYLVRPGFVFNILNRLIRKFASINNIRNFFFKLYNIFCAEGDERSCQHIVAVYRKI